MRLVSPLHWLKIADKPLSNSTFLRSRNQSRNNQWLKRFLVVSAIVISPSVISVVTATAPAFAETKAPEEENQGFANFLEITEPDPLLPNLPIRRELSPVERGTLALELDKLAAQGEQARQAGDLEAALEIWHRELRLRRFLGVLSEVKALGRVGDVVWQNNLPVEVRLIRERLETLQQNYTSIQTGRREIVIPGVDLNPPEVAFILPTLPSERVDRVLLQRSLGIAYQKLRARQLALTIYNQQLADARAANDRRLEEASLIILGALHLNWFDYSQAAATYQALLPLAPIKSSPPAPKRSQDDELNDPPRLTKAEVWEKLAYAYEQDKQWEAAIATHQQRIEFYEGQREKAEIPKLLLAIARDYQAAGNTEQAIANYQRSYLQAQTLKQFGYASDALNELGAIYMTQEQPEKALQIYQFLLEVDQQAYNDYSRMTTYDKIGKIYLMLQNYAQAVAAFRQGLAIAKQLKYQEDYFTNQIQAIETQRMSQ